MMKNFFDDEFEEIERMLYEEKVCFVVEMNVLEQDEVLENFFDEEFKEFEKVLYEQKV